LTTSIWSIAEIPENSHILFFTAPDMSVPTDHLPLDDGSIRWRKATSQNGKSFEIGVATSMESRSEISQTIEQDFARKGKTEFSIFVKWPVGQSLWTTTSSEVQDIAAITEYQLYEYNGFWKYVLHFKNTLTYDYQFKDESGDVYRCDTFVTGDHYIRYDSDQPTITKVMGR
jgi:hypothetical protein